MQKRRLWAWAAVTVAAIVVTWTVVGSRGSGQPAEQREIVPVERGPITMTVSTTGRVVANLDVDIKCKASGEVLRLPKDVSDRVKKGELLVELDPADEERRVKQAEVALSASRARH